MVSLYQLVANILFLLTLRSDSLVTRTNDDGTHIEQRITFLGTNIFSELFLDSFRDRSVYCVGTNS